ncbi:MAG: PCRF domain-containing protein, partial [Planctomycetes bacterium]|nr:PCRF domain-containing protein [Planctomycetota bacterium]
MGGADFWSNAEKAQATVAELKGVNAILKPLDEALAVGCDLEALEELAREDSSLESELAAEVERLGKLVDNLELASLLSGPHDASDALVSIHARDGGTDANDWAEMLLRMYSAWANKHDCSVELLDRQ